MKIQEHVSLKELTTMKIGGIARYFCSATTREEVERAVAFAREKEVPVAILGGGSNILIANGTLNALVLKIEINGIEWESPLESLDSRRLGALPSSAGGMLTTPGLGDSATPFGKGDTRTPMDEKNMRALVRIAAGTKYGEEELRNAFEDLPLGLRQSLSSVDTANSIQEIAKKYLLHVDQMAALASETGLVLLGLTHPADFIKNLAGRLRVPEERAKEIARETSSQILVKVRESLRSLHAEVVQPPPVAVGPRLPAETSF